MLMHGLFPCHSIGWPIEIIILPRCLHCDTTLVLHCNPVWYEEYLDKQKNLLWSPSLLSFLC